MRIIGGNKRGFKLIGSPEVQIEGLKPMPDMVRESLFNILGEWIKGKEVLDLYAGTGALGLESKSRGAKNATFVEISKKTTEIIRKNLEKLNFTPLETGRPTPLEIQEFPQSQTGKRFLTGLKGLVFQKGVLEFLSQTKEKYDLIFITPPHKEINFGVVELAGAKLKENGIIVLESDKKTEILDFKSLKIFDQRTYGRLKLSFLQLKK